MNLSKRIFTFKRFCGTGVVAFTAYKFAPSEHPVDLDLRQKLLKSDLIKDNNETWNNERGNLKFARVLALASAIPVPRYGMLDGERQIAEITHFMEERYEKVVLYIKALQRAARSAGVFCELAMKYKLVKWKHQNDRGSEAHRKELSKVHLEGAKIILKLCRTNGGIFVKLGQHAASLKPAIPDEYVETLQVLQDQAPVKDFELVELVLRDELRIPADVPLVYDDYTATSLSNQSPFLELEKHPVGSASLAQVHRGKLRDGRTVAIKVQHFGLEDIVQSDVVLVTFFDYLASKLFRDEGFSLSWAVEEFERNIVLEMDFKQESLNCSKIRGMFLSDKRLHSKIIVPEVHSQFCTDKVIVMDYIQGIPLHDNQKMLEAGVDCRNIASIFVDAFGAMFFDYGFIHCDPHPGNLLVSTEYENGRPVDKLVILDHGLYIQLDDSFRRHNCGIWKAMVIQDNKSLKENAAAIGLTGTTWKLLPFILINRSTETQSQLGKSSYMSIEERNQLVDKLGISEMNISKAGNLVGSFPPEMVWIMRTMHLVKDLHEKLGGKKSERFHTYAHHANAGMKSSNWRVVNAFSQLHFIVSLWLMETKMYLYFELYAPLMKREMLSRRRSRFSMSDLFREDMEQKMVK